MSVPTGDTSEDWYVYAEQDSFLDWLTAIGTVGAAVAALMAIVVSQAVLRAERRHQRFRERYRDAVDLLVAFEAVRAAIPQPWRDKKGTGPTEQDRRVAAAHFLALLRASEERLPITRGMQRHMPFGADNEADAKHLREAPLVGDPEQENPEVMAQRGEILHTIEELRARL